MPAAPPCQRPANAPPAASAPPPQEAGGHPGAGAHLRAPQALQAGRPEGRRPGDRAQRLGGGGEPWLTPGRRRRAAAGGNRAHSARAAFPAPTPHPCAPAPHSPPRAGPEEDHGGAVRLAPLRHHAAGGAAAPGRRPRLARAARQDPAGPGGARALQRHPRRHQGLRRGAGARRAAGAQRAGAEHAAGRRRGGIRPPGLPDAAGHQGVAPPRRDRPRAGGAVAGGGGGVPLGAPVPGRRRAARAGYVGAAWVGLPVCCGCWVLGGRPVGQCVLLAAAVQGARAAVAWRCKISAALQPAARSPG